MSASPTIKQQRIAMFQDWKGRFANVRGALAAWSQERATGTRAQRSENEEDSRSVRGHRGRKREMVDGIHNTRKGPYKIRETHASICSVRKKPFHCLSGTTSMTNLLRLYSATCPSAEL